MNGVDAIAGFKSWALESSKSTGTGASTATPTGMQSYLNNEMLIIGMSAGALQDDMAGAFLKGMHYFLPKPVTQEQLIAVIKVKKNSSSLDSARDKLDDISLDVNSPADERKQKPQKQPRKARPTWDGSWKLFSSVPNPMALFNNMSSTKGSTPQTSMKGRGSSNNNIAGVARSDRG